MLEGAVSEGIAAMAKCGNFQLHKANAHRDLASLCCKNLCICDPVTITVDVLDPNTRKVVNAEASLFQLRKCAAFWKGVEDLEDPRLAPPLALGKRVIRPEYTCPIFLHGDGVEYQTNDLVMGLHPEQQTKPGISHSICW